MGCVGGACGTLFLLTSEELLRAAVTGVEFKMETLLFPQEVPSFVGEPDLCCGGLERRGESGVPLRSWYWGWAWGLSRATRSRGGLGPQRTDTKGQWG